MEPLVSGSELVAALERFVRFLRQVAPTDLSATAASTLRRVLRAGPQQLTELARAEGVSQPAMTQLVTRLERDGLVRRIASEEDRRVVLVEATDVGGARIASRRAAQLDALQPLLDRLDEHDRAAIAAALPALIRLVEEADR